MWEIIGGVFLQLFSLTNLSESRVLLIKGVLLYDMDGRYGT